MDTPERESPSLISVIKHMGEATVARVNESLAKQEKRLAERDAALRAEMSGLRGDMEKRDTEAAKRESRLMRWFLTVAVGAVVVLGFWIELRIDLRDGPTTPPVTINNPPPIIYTAPPTITPPPAVDSR